MKWVLSNGDKTRTFKTLEDAGRFLGYSGGWVGQRYRMNQPIEGYTITKQKTEVMSHHKKYGYGELLKRLDEQEIEIENLKHEIEELYQIKRLIKIIRSEEL